MRATLLIRYARLRPLRADDSSCLRASVAVAYDAEMLRRHADGCADAAMRADIIAA